MRRRKTTVFVLVMVLAGLILLPAPPVLGKVGPSALLACRDAAFSTEEDFITQGPEPADGNPRISDGDLLSPNGVVCARNADLLSVFSPQTPLPDLGLDAVDIVDAQNYLVAFSTSLDDPNGRFTAGDLLVTNGAIIPNVALVNLFGVSYDIGLDEVKFTGKLDGIKAFLAEASDRARDYWLEQGRLRDALQRREIDIWFSTEGTWTPAGAAGFLDGDILSAATGTIVVSQSAILPTSVPAGIPNRGVDFGVDAFAVPRNGNREQLYFSTEILYEAPKEDGLSFTDGDVLLMGDGVISLNWSLIAAFEPKARMLGLDALFIDVGPPPVDPNIQTMCGDRPVADFVGGLVPIGGLGTGLYRTNLSTSPPGDPPRRPCGKFVPIDGYLPSSVISRFRVAYRGAADPAPAIGTASGIRTNWTLYEWHGFPINACLPTDSLSTDADGWMDASDYLGAKDGTLTGCANSGLRLAVWDTDNVLGLGPPDKNAHYRLWLEWEDAGGLHREPVEHHLQLDNTLPTIAPYPDGLEVRLADGSTVVPACGEAPDGTSEFQVWGQFDDDYYWQFRLVVRGGLPPASASFGPHNYWDANDGTTGIKNTNDTGTTPDNNTVHLRDISMTALGASFQDCCYVLDLYVHDAAIRHSFNGRVTNDSSGSSAYRAHTFVTFAAAP